MTVPDLWDVARDAGQKQAASGLPAGTRAHVLEITRAIIRSGARFTFPPCEPPPGELVPLRNVYDELAPMQRELLDRHPAFLGNVTTALQKTKEIEHKGRAKTKSHVKRKYVGVWQSPTIRR